MALLKRQAVAAARSEPNLTDRITETLIEEITSGLYKPGEVLPPEQVIADRLGVSRTVLREAVSRLKADGIVTSKQGRGLTVMLNTRPSVLRMQAAQEGDVEEILRIVELRRGFEIEAAAIAAQRRTAQDLADMRVALDTMSAAIQSSDVVTGIDADLNFHRAIARATRNEHYLNFFDFLSVLVRRNLEVSRSRSARSAGRGAQAQSEHEALYGAIERQDTEQARLYARAHIENTESRLHSANFLKRQI